MNSKFAFFSNLLSIKRQLPMRTFLTRSCSAMKVQSVYLTASSSRRYSMRMDCFFGWLMLSMSRGDSYFFFNSSSGLHSNGTYSRMKA